MNTTKTVVYVAPAMIKSIALILIRQDKAAINPVVAKTTITNLAVKPSIKLQIITGVRRRTVTRGTRKTRTALCINDGGKMYMSDSCGFSVLANHLLK